jgi:hypothetical protein
MSLILTPEAAANIAAAQIVSQVNNVLNQISTALEKGVPARPNQPAISADDLKEALGADNLAKIEAAKTALS